MAKEIDYKVKFPHGVDMYSREKFLKVFEDRFDNAGKIFDALTIKKSKKKE